MTTAGTPVPQPERPDPTDAGDTTTNSANTSETPDTGNPSREAAKWRTKFRDAERENAALRERLDKADTDRVNALAVKAGIDPRHFVNLKYDLPALRDDDGQLDPEKITAAIDHVKTAFPQPPRRIGTGGRPPAGNVHQGAGGGRAGESPSWSNALRGE